MTTTYLVTYGDGSIGTYPVEAHDDAEALRVARTYKGDHDWRIVSVIAPAPAPVPYTPAFATEAERLAFERGQERALGLEEE